MPMSAATLKSISSLPKLRKVKPSEDRAKMQMCDLCLDRILEGKSPICVEACGVRALDYGPMEEMKTKYGEVKDVVGFSHSTRSEPSIIFKPKR